jgi:flagellar protein FliJ
VVKKFSYRMQNILNIQYKLEEQAKTILGEANKRLLEEQSILTAFLNQKENYDIQYRESMTSYLDFQKINELRRAIEVMKSRIRTQMISVHVAEKNVDNARSKLQEIMIVRKSHEVLREKAMEEYRIEMNKEEVKEIDQLVSYKYTKSNQLQ